MWALPFILGLGVAHDLWSASTLGWILGVRTAGFVIAVPIGGVLADQMSRSRVTFLSGTLAAFGTVMLALALPHSVFGASAVAFFVGLGQGSSRPAYLAMIQEIVPAARRQEANAMMTISIRLAVLFGPGLAALASRYIGDINLIYATAALWILAAVLPIGLSSQQSAPERSIRRVGTDFIDGLREARRHTWFMAGIFALTGVITFGYSATYIALPVISRDRFGSDLVLTLGLMAYTVGGILGAVVISRWRPHHIGWIALAGNGAYALAPLALAFAFDQWFILGTYVLVGIGVEFFNVPWFTAIQREVPADMVARVSSVDFLVSYGLAPVGLAALAPAINTFGMTAVLVTCAIMCIAATAVAMLPAASRTFRTPAVSP